MQNNKNYNIELIEPYLDKLSIILDELAESQVSQASFIARQLFSAGGKRLRPALVILSALAASSNQIDEKKMLMIAAAAELVHSASLIHDDVVDETKERRGKPTANAKLGNKLSVLGGDFLLSKAFTILASQNDPKLMAILSANATSMAESEMLQASSEGNLDLWRDNYWRIIEGKTAGFFKVCCGCGAIIAKSDSSIYNALCDYGLKLGLSFQITDDILDFTNNSKKTGKDSLTDITNGKFTLPLILALDNIPADKKADLEEILRNNTLNKQEAASVAEIVSLAGGIEAARNSAKEKAEQAIESISILPQTPYKDALVSLAQSIVVRMH